MFLSTEKKKDVVNCATVRSKKKKKAMLLLLLTSVKTPRRLKSKHIYTLSLYLLLLSPL